MGMEDRGCGHNELDERYIIIITEKRADRSDLRVFSTCIRNLPPPDATSHRMHDLRRTKRSCLQEAAIGGKRLDGIQHVADASIDSRCQCPSAIRK